MVSNSRIKLLVNDSSRLGPGCYNASNDLLKRSGKVSVDFSKFSKRTLSFVKNSTMPQVGPGSYETTQRALDRKINSPTIPRASNSVFEKSKRRNNGGSIKSNFEIESDSDDGET